MVSRTVPFSVGYGVTGSHNEHSDEIWPRWRWSNFDQSGKEQGVRRAWINMFAFENDMKPKDTSEQTMLP